MIMIYGGRQTGRTTTIIDHLARLAGRRDSGPALLLVDDYQSCNWTDRLIVEMFLWADRTGTSMHNVVTKPVAHAADLTRGQRWGAIGVDVHGDVNLERLQQTITAPIDAFTLTTPGRHVRIVDLSTVGSEYPTPYWAEQPQGGTA